MSQFEETGSWLVLVINFPGFRQRSQPGLSALLVNQAAGTPRGQTVIETLVPEPIEKLPEWERAVR